jgi:hypothetical protein
MVTLSPWSRRAASAISIFASGGTRVPSVSTTTPSTRTQRLAIHSSASRREHRPRSLISLDSRGSSAD